MSGSFFHHFFCILCFLQHLIGLQQNPGTKCHLFCPVSLSSDLDCQITDDHGCNKYNYKCHRISGPISRKCKYRLCKQKIKQQHTQQGGQNTPSSVHCNNCNDQHAQNIHNNHVFFGKPQLLKQKANHCCCQKNPYHYTKSFQKPFPVSCPFKFHLFLTVLFTSCQI